MVVRYKILVGKKKYKRMGGDRGVFKGNRRGIKRHQQSIKCRTIENLLQVTCHWRGFYRDIQNPAAARPRQEINNTGPLRKMSLVRAELKNNFNSKETGKPID